MKILFRCIFNAALFLMLIVAMVLLLPGLFGIRPYVVYSGSMEPKIPTGAVVFTKEGAYSPETGDIITFHNEDTVVTHRVVKKEEGTFITKGDANKNADPIPVAKSQIIGRVVFCLPYLGYIIYFLKARIPFTAVCIMAGLSVISDLAYTPKKNKKIAWRNEFMMKNRKMVKGIALGAMIAALAAGGTAAYLTDFETTTNSFTVGKVDIELDEPGWKPEENTKIVPTQVIKKDPYVKNVGVNEAFVYLEVSVPVSEVITAAQDGTRNALAKTELFSYAKNNDWTQLEKKEIGQNMVYTYAYNHILNPGEKTTTLFDTVTFANIIEGQLDTQQLDMPVRAYAIQSMNTGDDSTTVLEQAKAAYQKYVNQNKGQAGGVTR